MLSDGQWQDKGYHEFLLRWFASGSKSVILVTSREQPDLPRNISQFWYSLDGLDEDAGIALLRGEEIPGSDEELKEFVHQADGHPLLLKLAAGLLRDEQEEIGSLTSPPTSLGSGEGRNSPIFSLREGEFAGISSLFDILGLHRDDPEASIAKILDASLQRLAPERRTLLFYLSVYRLPFDWEAGLGNGEDKQGKIIDKELRVLVKRSLLQEEKQQGVWKFSFQPLIQAYLQKISEVQTQAHQGAIAYYKQRQKLPLTSSDGWDAVREYLEIFHHHCELREFAQAYETIQQQTNSDYRYSACDMVLQLRGFNAARLTLYERLVEEWEPETDEEVQPFIDSLKVYGDVLQFLDRRQEALDKYQQALSFYRHINDRLGEANTLQAIGDVLQFLDRRQEALDKYQQALSFYRHINDRLGEANTLKAIGDVLQFLDRRQEALDKYQQALSFYRHINDRLGEANTLKAIGDVLQFLDRRQEALDKYQQALSFYRDINARLGEANTLQALGKLQPNPASALEYLQQAQEIYARINDIYSQSRNLLFIADVQLKMTDKDGAITSLTQAQQLAITINYAPFQDYAQGKISEINSSDLPAQRDTAG